jgi:SIR2-like domain
MNRPARQRGPLDSFPEPLLSDLVAGRWLPLVGAGLSKNAQLAPRSRMPDWKQLGEEISNELPPGYGTDSPMESLSAYEHAFGRGKLVERVQRALYVTTARPDRVHVAFCSIPFDVVVTTNVDQLLEQQYRTIHGSVLSVIEDEQLALPNPYRAPQLVKAHGDLHHPSTLVLTEQDYDEYLLRRPLTATWLANHLISRTAVLMGYSLEDPDLRQLLAAVRTRLGNSRPPLYALQVNASSALVDRFERRGVRVINLPRSREGWGVLANVFDALRDLWASQLPSQSTATTTALYAALRAQTRVDALCLFLVAAERLPEYEDFVFPAVVTAGLVPVTLPDLQVPQGSSIAAVESLLNASGLIVVEGDTPADPTVLRAVRAAGTDRVLLVQREPVREPPQGERDFPARIVMAPRRIEDYDGFAQDLVAALRTLRERIAERQRATGRTEAEELLQRRLYRAAFLSGVVELEARLRRLMSDFELQPSRKGGPTLSRLLEQATARGLLEISPMQRGYLVENRNAVVHGRDIPNGQLRTLAELVVELLLQLPE